MFNFTEVDRALRNTLNFPKLGVYLMMIDGASFLARLKIKFLYLLSIFFVIIVSRSALAGASNYSILPLQFFSHEPVAKIRLNGYQTNLIVDLGTSDFDLLLSKRLLDKSRAKLIKIDDKNFLINYRRQKYPIKYYLISNTQLGDLKLKNLSAIQFPGMNFFSDQSERHSTVLDNGTIGINLLKKFNVIFDYAHHRMVLIKNDNFFKKYKVDKWVKIPIYYAASGNILTKGSINNLPVRIILDTGNNASSMSAHFANKLKTLNKNQYLKVNEHNIVSDLAIYNYHLGTQSFQIHNTQPEADISLGWYFFSNHRVYFNFKGMYMAIN